MRHLILIGILMVSLGIGTYFDWNKLYHPAGPIEEMVEPVDNQIELWHQDKNQPIINSEIIFGSVDNRL